jgi:hypothetical protein
MSIFSNIHHCRKKPTNFSACIQNVATVNDKKLKDVTIMSSSITWFQIALKIY